MHRPETWGFLQFSDNEAGSKTIPFNYNEDEDVKWELMKVYYAQRSYRQKTGKYADNIETLKKAGLDADALKYIKNIETTASFFEARAARSESKFIWHINQNSKIWKSRN